MRRTRLRQAAGAVLALGLGGFAAPAGFAAGSPPPNPSIAQYVEMLPTSAGPRTVGGAGRARRLSPAAAAAVRHSGGRDAKALTTIATSPSLGAPVRRREPRTVGHPSLPKLGRYAAPGFTSGIGAALGSAGGPLTGMLASLLVLTGVALGAVALRRRQSRA